MSTDALIVFAKPPTPGRVKTRLTPALTEETAAALYAAFLKDALLQYGPLPMDVRLYLGNAAPAVEAWAQEQTDADVHYQHGPGLGKRMARAFVESFAAGYERLVIIGTDHPTLPTPFIAQAFERLDTPRAVTLGPSTDGGYYLLGMNDYFPELFHEMTYSHGEVFSETLARAHNAGAQITILPSWYDVDEPTDLQRLTADLASQPPAEAPHTRAQLEALSLSNAQPRDST
ncbi:MAG: DUF2064 domain-containing protein [Bacteroidetes bacterium]|jgi:rSAM/selenodomain-associated transferase 1|nr:DUF2064 domain-containing protein [Bacteroidota bacterium]